MTKRETTPEAQRLLDEAAKDYAAGWGANTLDKAEKDTTRTTAVMAAQRGANHQWGDGMTGTDGGNETPWSDR